LPKPVRDALRIKAGARLSVAIEGTRVILDTAPASPLQSWKPLNPAGVRLSNRELCKPVELSRTDASRSG
jgi:bifunctional DNA-binding transcriptional regulator/antitoxin component of YhaV-PrlF toxin-antitoxin module